MTLPPSRWHICSAALPPLLKPSLCPPHVLHLPGNGVTQVTKKETMVTMALPSPRCLGAKLCGEKCEASCARIYTHACKIGFLASSWKRWHGNTLLLAGLPFSPLIKRRGHFTRVCKRSNMPGCLEGGEREEHMCWASKLKFECRINFARGQFCRGGRQVYRRRHVCWATSSNLLLSTHSLRCKTFLSSQLAQLAPQLKFKSIQVGRKSKNSKLYWGSVSPHWCWPCQRETCL